MITPDTRLGAVMGIVLVFVVAYGFIQLSPIGQVVGGNVSPSSGGLQVLSLIENNVPSDDGSSLSQSNDVLQAPSKRKNSAAAETVAIDDFDLSFAEKSLVTSGVNPIRVVSPLSFSSEENPGSISDNFNTQIISAGNKPILLQNEKGEWLPYLDYVPGSYILELNAPAVVKNNRITSNASLDASLKQLGDYRSRRLARDHKDGSLSRLVEVRLEKSIPADVALKLLREMNGVLRVSPNYLAKTSQTATGSGFLHPDDPLYGQQWMHTAIDIQGAWKQTLGKGAVIAIIDTGVDWQHEDLIENIWINKNEIFGNGIDDEGNGYIDDIIGWDFVDTYAYPDIPLEDFANEDNDPDDYFGHGTHVAGIAAAKLNNGKGIAGVCPNCKIMALKAGYAPGYLETADIVDAIVYAADNGADVINMSFGSSYDDFAEKAAIDYAYEKGVVLVAAAGNSASDQTSFPAGYNNVISVTATNGKNGLAYFSNYGIQTDIAAPGEKILSTVPKGGYYLSPYYPPLPGYSNYALLSGTSMASPVVAGVVGLVVSQLAEGEIDEVGASLPQSIVTAGITTFDTLAVGGGGSGSGSGGSAGGGAGAGYSRFFGNGLTNANEAVEITKQAPLPGLLFDKEILENMISGNFSISGELSWPETNHVTYSAYLSKGYYTHTDVGGGSFSITGPTGTLFTAKGPTEDYLGGAFTLHIQELDYPSGNVLREWQKGIEVENASFDGPIDGVVQNPNNGTVTLYGKLAGNVKDYKFIYVDKSGYEHTDGFNYIPMGGATGIVPLAVWTFPDLKNLEEGDAGDFHMNMRVTYPKEEAIIKHTYLYDYALTKGFPYIISPLAESSLQDTSLIATTWNVSNSSGPYTAFVYHNVSFPASGGIIKEARTYAIDSAGQLVDGWPVVYEDFYDSDTDTQYHLFVVGRAPTVGDVDGDGKDDLLVNTIYTTYDYALAIYSTQYGVYAYKEEGALIDGFPLFTHNTEQFSGGFDVASPPILFDIDNDGQKEIVVSGINDLDSDSWKSIVSIAKKGTGGKYSFVNTIKPTFPAADYHSLLFNQRTPDVAVGNFDDVPGAEIGLLSHPRADLGGIFDYYSFSASMGLFRLSDGSPLPGWPIVVHQKDSETLLQQRLVGGEFDGGVVVGLASLAVNAVSQLGAQVDLFDLDGNSLDGWPHFSLTNVPVPLVLSDVDGDDATELISNEFTHLVSFEKDGTVNSIWTSTDDPYTDQDFLDASPIVAELDGQTLLVGATSLAYNKLDPASQLVVFETDSNYPLLSKNFIGVPGTPFVTQFDSSGNDSEIVTPVSYLVSKPSGYSRAYFIYAWSYPFDIRSGDWSVYMHDNQRTNAFVPPVVEKSFAGIASSHGLYYWFSTDDITEWYPSTLIFGDPIFGDLTNVLGADYSPYGLNGTSPLTVFVGENGKMALKDEDGYLGIVSPFATSSITGVAHNGLSGINTRWVAVGDNGKMATSANGINWSLISNSVFGTTNINTVYYSSTGYCFQTCSGWWVAAGDNGKMAGSPDGINWELLPNAISVNINKVTHNGLSLPSAQWLGVGNNGKVLTTQDGYYWHENNDLGSMSLFDVAFNGKTGADAQAIVVGGNGNVFASSPSYGAWYSKKQNAAFGSSTVQTIEYAPAGDTPLWVAAGNDGKVRYSNDGDTWTTGPTNLVGATIWDITFGQET